ncbi:MAG: hypothetical protein ISS48_02450 [Candidatus Aenigmarchaeota archaeon]|nr:hypothetical protein [Candidatus Aenigmarchaeota archaeon]
MKNTTRRFLQELTYQEKKELMQELEEMLKEKESLNKKEKLRREIESIEMEESWLYY